MNGFALAAPDGLAEVSWLFLEIYEAPLAVVHGLSFRGDEHLAGGRTNSRVWLRPPPPPTGSGGTGKSMLDLCARFFVGPALPQRYNDPEE